MDYEESQEQELHDLQVEFESQHRQEEDYEHYN